MRKLYLLIASTFLFLFAAAQDREAELNQALRLVKMNQSVIGLTADEIANSKISDTYISSTSGLRLVYLQQTYKGLPVYNQIQTLAFRNDSLVSLAGERVPEIEKKVNVPAATPALSPEQAVRSALSDRNLPANGPLTRLSVFENGRKIEFNDMGISHENITAELMWSVSDDGEHVKLAWQVYVIPKTSSDYWLVRVDAINSSILAVDNLTVYDHWDHNSQLKYILAPQKKTMRFHPPGFKRYHEGAEGTAPFIVNDATYRVIPFPAESPIHPGGAPALVTNPWTNAPGNATTLKWHSNGTSDYNITRGNNVWAKEDRAGNNSNSGLPATSTTSPDPLTFDFVPNFNVPPTQTSPVQNQQFNITNLFYWINIFHDVTYLYGFDEPAGNFQANNLGRGGAGNDWVYGDAQDGSGMNNANFSTPADGGSGRMQMFLWSAVPRLTVNSPATIAGQYAAVEGAMSTNNLLANVGPVTGQVVYYNDDPAGNTHYACNPPANSVAGKIAMIDRGFGGTVCTATVPFTVKVKNAQDAGAIAVIVVNNVPGDPITMGGTDNTIIIPAVMISQSDGAIIAAQLANNVNVTLAPGVQLDGDVDNGIIVHEYGHGLSNRLTGGPAAAGCLGNAEQMGEGWSDYYALMFTQNWITSNLNTGFNSPRGIGCYAIGQGPNGSGIRTQKYCTDFNVNNKVYATTIPTSPHDRGEIWCAILWDMTWNIIQQTGTITPNIYDVNGTGGNIIALKLVTEGMKLQPCSPGFVTGRNAILQADENLFGGQYKCAIWEAFRRRGVGYNASQGSSASVTDQIPDFSPFEINITSHPQNASACSGGNVTFSVTATGPGITYQWQVSTNGGTTWSNISGATTTTLNLNGVTPAMNNYRYRCVMNAVCSPVATSNAAILTINSTVSITQQPTDVTVCENGNVSFTSAGSGGSINYQWQVSTDGGTTFNNITNGGVYSGATTATLTITGVTTAMNNYRYRCQLSNASCPTPAATNAAVLTVNTLPAISAHPQNAALCTGNNHTFTVSASGTAITYQWQVSSDGGATYNNIAGATSSSHSLTGVTSGLNGNRYRCVVSGVCTPAATSNAAVLTVVSPVSITAQPVNSTICESGNVTFNVTGSSAETIIYQWQVSSDGGASWNNINGATAATLNLNGVTAAMNNNRYRCILSSATCPSPATSNAATLTVNPRPTVTLSAAPTTKLLPGRTTTLTATIQPSATGLDISWYRNGVLIPGVTGTTYLVDVMNLGDYRVNIVNTSTGCNNQSNVLNISDSASNRLFIFPNPNDGHFTVSYYNSTGASTSRTVTVFDEKGAKLYQKQFAVSGPYTLLDINLGAAQRAVYLVVVSDAGGHRLAEGKVLVH
jgi:hypothetical protein